MSRFRPQPAGGARVGLFGQLGSTNIGNDGSLEAVLTWLANDHPTATIDCFCTGHEQVSARYGLPTTPLHWYPSYDRTLAGPLVAPLKVLGKAFDAFRTLRWVGRHDVVIVPGMGVLETTLPLRPWGFPYALFLMCAAGRLTRTKVAMIDVGADVIVRPATRRLLIWAARLATHRSYRDALSKDAMRRMGVDVAADEVVADLVFSLPVPPARPAEPGTVGVGVMSWHGADADRERAAEIHSAYLEVIKGFVRWLLVSGRRVRLFTGDRADAEVIDAIRADVNGHGLDAGGLVVEPAPTLDDLVRQMSAVDSVVATRYHNVVCALRLAKPTVSVSYAAKGDALMAEMGMAEFCHSAHSPDLPRLISQFTAVESRREQAHAAISERTAGAAQRLRRQAADLSVALFDDAEPAPVPHREPSQP